MDLRLINVALGKEKADIVIKGGKLINVHTREVYDSDIAVAGNKIAAIGNVDNCIGENTKIIDASGYYLSPGFIDAHIHFESSMLSYTEFSKMVLKRGTTVVASDLMEVTIVSGVEGMKEVLKESESNPVTLVYPVPSFMSDSHLQTTGSILGPELIEELIDLPQAIGLAEVLVPPVLGGSPVSANVLKLARDRRKTAEGHAPVTVGASLNAYASAGIRSDHEATTCEEALEKLRAGLRLLIREGAAATDLLACIKVVTEKGVDPRHCAMVSDDIDALHISKYGHLDHKIRMAVKAGVDPIVAIQMSTLNPAESLKIDEEHGSITPGKYADIVFISSLDDCKVEKVIAKGQMVVEDSKVIGEIKTTNYPDKLLNTVRFKNVINAEDLVIKVSEPAAKARVRVIGASSTSLLTDALEAELEIKDGAIQPDISSDILHIATIERYGLNGGIGKSFIKGFGLKSGAIATSVGHDHHNVTTLGTNPEDMAFAANRIQELGGGIVVVQDGKVLSEIPLPICGLLTNTDGEIVAGIQKEMLKKLNEMGCHMPAPFMTLSFITLIFIPRYGITDKGLIDVFNMEIVDPIIKLL